MLGIISRHNSACYREATFVGVPEIMHPSLHGRQRLELWTKDWASWTPAHMDVHHCGTTTKLVIRNNCSRCPWYEKFYSSFTNNVRSPGKSLAAVLEEFRIADEVRIEPGLDVGGGRGIHAAKVRTRGLGHQI